jgi:SAM-dependent methyltransferase
VKDWWKTHFSRKSLEGYGLPKKTSAEVRGVAKMLGLRAPADVLDLCCGTGRHAVGLAALGHRVTGLDWSAELLAAAAEESARRGVTLDLVRGDMRRLRYRRRFDAVVNLFTSFGYFETEREDIAVLNGVRRALRPGGVFLIDVLNKEWLMRHFTPKFRQDNPEGDVRRAYNRLSFDPVTSRLDNRRTVISRDGRKRETFLRFKVYTLHDLVRLVETAGMKVQKAYGGFDGRPYGLDTFRTVLMAQKTPAKRSSGA